MRIPAFWRTALLVLALGIVSAIVADAVRAPRAAAGEERPTYLVNRDLFRFSSPWLDLNPSAMAEMDEVAEEISASGARHAR